MPGSQPRALDVALRALARRELSVAELTARLRRAGLPAEDAAEAIAYLQQADYQSDARAATERARVLASRNFGDGAIAADLRRRGIDPETIAIALAGLAPEIERARRLAAARARQPTSLARLLHGKGFSAETVEAVLEALIADGS